MRIARAALHRLPGPADPRPRDEHRPRGARRRRARPLRPGARRRAGRASAAWSPALGHRHRVPRRWIPAAGHARSRCSRCCRSPRRPGARAATRSPSRSRSPCAAPLLALWPLCSRRPRPVALALWLDARRGVALVSDAARARGMLDSSTSRRSCPGTRGRRGRSRRGRCGARAARSRRAATCSCRSSRSSAFFVVALALRARRARSTRCRCCCRSRSSAWPRSTRSPRGAASALDWFGRHDLLPAGRADLGRAGSRRSPAAPRSRRGVDPARGAGLQVPVPLPAFALAALLTLIWLVVVARSLRTTRRALVNWTAGITMVWMLVMTLGVPLIDQARSYRGRGRRSSRRCAADRLQVRARRERRRCAARAARPLSRAQLLPASRRCPPPRAASVAAGAGVARARPAAPARAGPRSGAARAPATSNELFILYRRSRAAVVEDLDPVAHRPLRCPTRCARGSRCWRWR